MAEADKAATMLNPCAFHLQKLELDLKCPLCWKLLNKPTLLPCDHIFCYSCVPKSSQFSTQCPTCQLNFIDQDMKPSSYLENIVTIYKSLDAAFKATIVPLLTPNSGTPATISTPSEQKRKKQCETTPKVKDEQAASSPDNHASNFGMLNNCPMTKELGAKRVPVVSPGSFPSPAEHYTSDPVSKDGEAENQTVEKSVDNNIGTAVDGVNDDDIHKRRSKKQKKLDFGSSEAILQSHGYKQKIVPDSDQDAASNCNDKCKIEEGTPLISLAAPCDASDVNGSICAFCHSSKITEWTGQLWRYAQGKAVERDEIDFPNAISAHIKCLLWTPRVYFVGEVIQNLESELDRASKLKCSKCGLKGAALGCFAKSCRRSYHVPCSVEIPDCRWDCENYLMLCPKHKSIKFPSEKLNSKKHQSKEEGPLSRQSASPQSTFGATSPNGPQDRVFCVSDLSPEEKVLVVKFASKCGSTVFKFWNPNITHVFTSTDSKGACKRTKEVLMAILNGRWILTTDWIKACVEADFFVDEEPYEVNLDNHGSRNGPTTGRLMASIKAPKLFGGSSFYFHSDLVNKSDLQDLVTAGGGTIVESVEEIAARRQSTQDKPKMYVVYNGDFPLDRMEAKTFVVLAEGLAGAQAIAKSTDAKIIPHTWILGSIAGCMSLPCDQRRAA